MLTMGDDVTREFEIARSIPCLIRRIAFITLKIILLTGQACFFITLGGPRVIATIILEVVPELTVIWIEVFQILGLTLLYKGLYIFITVVKLALVIPKKLIAYFVGPLAGSFPESYSHDDFEVLPSSHSLPHDLEQIWLDESGEEAMEAVDAHSSPEEAGRQTMQIPASREIQPVGPCPQYPLCKPEYLETELITALKGVGLVSMNGKDLDRRYLVPSDQSYDQADNQTCSDPELSPLFPASKTVPAVRLLTRLGKPAVESPPVTIRGDPFQVSQQ
jgi:hypothetical protein